MSLPRHRRSVSVPRAAGVTTQRHRLRVRDNGVVKTASSGDISSGRGDGTFDPRTRHLRAPDSAVQIRICENEEGRSVSINK
jgi:hypothetical protein